MNFLILRKKKVSQPLFLGVFIIITIFLFVVIPKNVFANSFFVVTQLPIQLYERMSTLSGFISNNESENANVWFEYGKNGKLEKSSNPQTIKGTQDFTANIYDLEVGIVYSYRAAGRNKNSNVIKYGEKKTFIIEGGSVGSSGSLDNSSSQQTNNSSSQTSGQCVVCCQSEQTVSIVSAVLLSETVETTNTTATLCGVVFTGDSPTRGWFEWGATNSLDRVTPAKKLNNSSRVEMKEIITGLSSGTTYYYRIVAVTSSGVSKTTIMSFTTQGEKEKDIIGAGTGAGKENIASSFGIENLFKQEPKNIENNNILENKNNNEEETLNGDSLGGVFAWGSSLRGQFFNINEKGTINTKISFNEIKKEKQDFLLAGAIFNKNFLPSTWSDWGFITIFLYLIISRTHYFLRSRKKIKKEKKEREDEIHKAQDFHLEQTTNGGGLIA